MPLCDEFKHQLHNSISMYILGIAAQGGGQNFENTEAITPPKTSTPGGGWVMLKPKVALRFGAMEDDDDDDDDDDDYDDDDDHHDDDDDDDHDDDDGDDDDGDDDGDDDDHDDFGDLQNTTPGRTKAELENEPLVRDLVRF